MATSTHRNMAIRTDKLSRRRRTTIMANYHSASWSKTKKQPKMSKCAEVHLNWFVSRAKWPERLWLWPLWTDAAVDVLLGIGSQAHKDVRNRRTHWTHSVRFVPLHLWPVLHKHRTLFEALRIFNYFLQQPMLSLVWCGHRPKGDSLRLLCN